MKNINRFWKIMTILSLSIISGCSQSSQTLMPPKISPQKPPCARYHYGTVIFENINKHDLMLYMQYNAEQYIESKNSIPIIETPSGSHQYKYKEMRTKKQKGGTVSFDVCDCETTYVTLPSKRYYSCEMFP